MKRLLICLFILVSSSSFAQPGKKGIAFFTGTMKEALQQAKAENKKLFFDAYASWCGPCKYMDSAIYTDEEVGAFFNKHFISIRVDMEKGEGPDLAKKLPSINGYPSLLFISSGGIAFKTVLGSMGKEKLLGEARLAVLD